VASDKLFYVEKNLEIKATEERIAALKRKLEYSEHQMLKEFTEFAYSYNRQKQAEEVERQTAARWVKRDKLLKSVLSGNRDLVSSLYT